MAKIHPNAPNAPKATLHVATLMPRSGQGRGIQGTNPKYNYVEPVSCIGLGGSRGSSSATSTSTRMISARLIFGLPLVCAPPKSIFSIYPVKPRASDDNKSDDAAARVSEDGASSLKSSVSGFGKNTKRYRAKGKGSSTLRLQPSEKPLLAAQPNEGINRFESIFVYALVALFGVIILDGITLAATGFLPQEWDDFLVKVLYPSFTPLVGIFVAGAAAYGLFKFLGIGNK